MLRSRFGVILMILVCAGALFAQDTGARTRT